MSINKNLKKKKEKSQQGLKTSIKEGSASAASAGFGDNFIAPFAVALKATPLQISFLSSLPNLLSPIAQSFGSRLIETRSRKNIVAKFVFFQALTWIPISILAVLFMASLFQANLPYLLIISYTLLAVLGGITAPAWFSWMGDIVPEEEKGKYFAKRNNITGVIGLAAIFFGALLLEAFEKKGYVMFGFAVLFALACVTRLIAYRYFKKQFCPKLKLKKEYYFSFWDFVIKYRNFTKFSVYNAFLNLSTSIAGPFFALYMLKDLGFSYITYIIIVLSGTIFTLLFTSLAGKFSDKYGNLKLIYIANILFIISIGLWIFIKSPAGIIFITQLVSGMAAAAWTISITNFIYDTVTPQRRAICVAYTSILVGTGIFIGSLIGGIVLDYLHPSTSLINPFIFLFLVSLTFRFLAMIIFLPKIKEIKHFKTLPKISLSFINPLRLVQAPFIWFRSVIIRK